MLLEFRAAPIPFHVENRTKAPRACRSPDYWREFAFTLTDLVGQILTLCKRLSTPVIFPSGLGSQPIAAHAHPRHESCGNEQDLLKEQQTRCNPTQASHPPYPNVRMSFI
jgi:hypothetical protein